jgi:FtsP/CotA-like multicopper oxidase with cupredoxin domain
MAAAVAALTALPCAPARSMEPREPVAACPARPTAGSVVAEPADLHSVHGVLRVDLVYRNSVDADGHMRFCYLFRDGAPRGVGKGRSGLEPRVPDAAKDDVQAPNLRLDPGDTLILRLANELSFSAPPAAMAAHGTALPGACTQGEMSAASTNLHFHGLSVAPACHQDDVLRTLIQPGDPPFEYRFRIPRNQPPGLYWYHPHVHGFTKAQVLGGASGALIVDGIERTDPSLAGLAERVFVIRDQELSNPDSIPVQTDSMPPPLVLRDAEGDILNSGTGGGKPAKDLSINFVPVTYPAYAPGVIKMRSGEKQLWRVLNASAITYLDLQVLIDNKPQATGVVALDGVPLMQNGKAANRILWQSHVLLPPAGRVEMIVRGPVEGARASLVTRTVDTGPAGENDPTRPLATIIAADDGDLPRLAASPLPLPRPRSIWIGDVAPARTRMLYFSEQPHDPHDPGSPTDFYLTVDGQTPRLFDPNSKVPDIIARQGDVEDWIIENRTQELHAFHIHQVHFMLMEWNGVPLDEPYLRDTINVAYWDGKSRGYPSVKLRMDFREPAVVGTFLYHCHLLEHEDGGMMGVIRVEPRRPHQPTAR